MGEVGIVSRHVSERDVLELAQMARVGLSPDEAESMTAELNAIIDTLAPLLLYADEGEGAR